MTCYYWWLCYCSNRCLAYLYAWFRCSSLLDSLKRALSWAFWISTWSDPRVKVSIIVIMIDITICTTYLVATPTLTNVFITEYPVTMFAPMFWCTLSFKNTTNICTCVAPPIWIVLLFLKLIFYSPGILCFPFANFSWVQALVMIVNMMA